MNTSNIEEMIQLYADGELELEKEIILFEQLNRNEEHRINFKKLLQIRSVVRSDITEVPHELEERILYSALRSDRISLKNRIFGRTSAIFAYAATVVLMIMSLLLYNEIRQYKFRIESVTQELKTNKQIIELLFNNLPTAEVRSHSINEIIIESNL